MYTHSPLDWDIRRPVTDPVRAALAQVVNKATTKDEPSPLSSSTTSGHDERKPRPQFDHMMVLADAGG